MSERFKVRVWDVQNQKYLYFDLLNSESLNEFAFFTDDETPDYNEQIKCPDTNCWALIIEQCTGLKDKNGKLIYENDIVELYDSTELVNAVIKWDGNAGCWDIKTTDTIYTFDNLYGNEMQIIGNIHENPELMEQSNDD